MASAADTEDQPDPNQNSDPVMPLEQDESPKTQILEISQPDDQEDPVEEEAANLDDPDSNVPPSSPPSTDLQVTTTSGTTSAAVGSRRGGCPKRKKTATKRRAQEKKSQKKLEVLTETLKPIPFKPNKTLDFSSHETLMKRLGLWDFVHLEFDGNVRSDLLAQLIATYNAQSRCSYVNGCRIMVNRADLARALKLSVKKDKEKDSVVEVEESKESIGFIEDFVSNWVLLHEDTWMMPVEVLNWTKTIKEGNFEKVDWAGMIWFMVEKELMAAPKLGNCYYASHMQCLIKFQREELLQEEPKMDLDEIKEEEEDIHGDVKTDADGIDEVHGGSQLEEHNVELTLGGQDNLMNKNDDDNDDKEAVEDEDVMDCEETKVDNHQNVQWPLDGNSYMRMGGEHFLQRCNIGGLGAVDLEEEKKQDPREEGDREDMEEAEEGEEEEDPEEEDEEEEQEPRQEEGFSISPKGDAFEGVNPTNLLDAMETADLPFTSGLHIRNNSSGEFLASRADTQTVPGVPFMSNGNKREIGLDNDFSHHSLNGSNKRLRTDGQWADKSSDLEFCMEQMQHYAAKARVLYAARDQAYADSSMHQQMLLDELQRKDNFIEYLQKAKYEEQTKRQVEVYRLERELFMMESLLEGYRKALKETNRAFAEHRALCGVSDEPLYKDVSGSGGLVLSTTELEKQRLKQEEEDRLTKLLIEKKIKDFEAEWIGKFDAHENAVSEYSTRLIDAEKDVKLLKESLANRKVPDTPEGVPEGGIVNE